MKKAISLTIIIAGLIFLYQYFAVMFKGSHIMEYKIEKDNVAFNIKESLAGNSYYFDVTISNYNFVFDKSNEFSKKKQIITDILYTSDNNMMCIYPVYDNLKAASITCSDSDQIYAYENVKNNSTVINLINLINEKKYIVELIKEDNVSASNKKNLSLYSDNIFEYITIWNYNGINIIDKENTATHKLINFDRYENTLGTRVGKYYIVPNYINSNLFEVDGFHIINLTNNDVKEVKTDFILTSNSYINGVIDNKIYIFDRNNMKQLEVDIKKKTAITISNGSTAKYYDNGWQDRNIYDFKNEIKFNTINKDEINANNVYEASDRYYIYENNIMYQVYKNNLSKKIILFTDKNIKEIKTVKNNLYYIKDTTLYRYDESGRRKLLTYSELKYNYKNIIDIYK